MKRKSTNRAQASASAPPNGADGGWPTISQLRALPPNLRDALEKFDAEARLAHARLLALDAPDETAGQTRAQASIASLLSIAASLAVRAFPAEAETGSAPETRQNIKTRVFPRFDEKRKDSRARPGPPRGFEPDAFAGAAREAALWAKARAK